MRSNNINSIYPYNCNKIHKSTFLDFNIKQKKRDNEDILINENYLDKFDELFILKRENEKYIDCSKARIILAKNAFEGILQEILNLKILLNEFKNKLKDKKDVIDLEEKYIKKFYNIKKNEYDEILLLFFNGLSNYANLQGRNSKGEKIHALLELYKNNNTRNISLTYIGFGGIVIDNCISKVDNILIDNLDDKIILQIGKCKLNIKKSHRIENFEILKLIEKIDKLLLNLVYIEKEAEKNIKILSYSLETICAVKKTLGITSNIFK